jgi:hypothetical protein
MASNVFISYRRGESAGYAERLHEAFTRATGEQYVFLDRASIPVGHSFEAEIKQRVDAANTVLVLMSKRWSSVLAADGTRRLDDPNDLVRREVEHALSTGKTVLPVLVQGAEMPRPEELPPSLQPLTSLQAFVVTDHHWRKDIARLVRQVAGVRLAYRVSTSWMARVAFGIAAFLAIVIVFAFVATRGIAQAGEQFLRELGDGQYDQAHAHLSPRAREVISRERLAARAKALRLSRVASFSWSTRNVSGERGELEGTATLANGEVVPIALELAKTTQGWGVSSIRAEGILEQGPRDQAVPPDQVVSLLTTQAVSTFVDAVSSGDFIPFWELGAQRFRDTNSPGALKERFSVVPLRGEKPGGCRDPGLVFRQAPAIGSSGDDHNVLVLIGVATCPATKLGFELYYARERDQWKLIGAGFKT